MTPDADGPGIQFLSAELGEPIRHVHIEIDSLPRIRKENP